MKQHVYIKIIGMCMSGRSDCVWYHGDRGVGSRSGSEGLAQ